MPHTAFQKNLGLWCTSTNSSYFSVGTRNILDPLETGVKVMCVPRRISFLGNTEFKANYATGNIKHISSDFQLRACFGLQFVIYAFNNCCSLKKCKVWSSQNWSTDNHGYPPNPDADGSGPFVCFQCTVNCIVNSKEAVPPAGS